MPDISEKAWDRDYDVRGRRWGRSHPGLPSLRPGALVLEAGCGDGKAIAAMVAEEWNVVATDFSKNALAICFRLHGACPNLFFVASDASFPPFPDNTFDAVFLTHIAGHALEPGRQRIAAESARVTRPGGKIILRDFARDDMRAGKGEEIEPGTFLRGDGIATHYFSEEEVLSLFSHLTPVSVRTRRWPLRIRGKDMVRSEIEAEFENE